MTAINLIAVATFLIALAVVTVVARRSCDAPLAWAGLGFGSAVLTAFATVTPIGVVLALFGEGLLRMTPGSVAYGALNMGVIAPGLEELFRLVFLLVALAYLPGQRGSVLGLGLTFGLAWGLGELFLRCMGFLLLLGGIEPPPMLAVMATTGIAEPFDATLMFAGRLAIFFWHGAISVLVISGIRSADSRPIWIAVGLHLAGNMASYMLAAFVTPFAGSLMVTLIIAAALFWLAMKYAAGEALRQPQALR